MLNARILLACAKTRTHNPAMSTMSQTAVELQASLTAALAEVERLKRDNAQLRAQQERQLLGPLLQKQVVGADDGRADDLKSKSYQMTGDRRDQDSWVKMAQNRAHMRGAGFQEADFTKPIVTVAVPYSNALECNNTLLDLARIAVQQIEKAGGIGFYCMAPAISDGNTQVRPWPLEYSRTHSGVPAIWPWHCSSLVVSVVHGSHPMVALRTMYHLSARPVPSAPPQCPQRHMSLALPSHTVDGHNTQLGMPLAQCFLQF